MGYGIWRGGVDFVENDMKRHSSISQYGYLFGARRGEKEEVGKGRRRWEGGGG